MAIYKHKNVAGCRSTDSHQHDRLPVPLPAYKDAVVLTKETKLHVGFPYIYGHFQPYSIVDGEVQLQKPTILPLTKTESSENKRTVIMINSLQQLFNDFVAGNDSKIFFPFSGGGDICILRKETTTSAALLQRPTSADDEVEQPAATITPQASSTNITPPRPGEHSCGATENKMSNTQSETDVRLQLQANMMLLTSNLL